MRAGMVPCVLLYLAGVAVAAELRHVRVHQPERAVQDAAASIAKTGGAETLAKRSSQPSKYGLDIHTFDQPKAVMELAHRSSILSHPGGGGRTWLMVVKGLVCVLLVPGLLYLTYSGIVSPVIIIVAWMVSSSAMSIANKLAATYFPATALLVIIQMMVADIVTATLQFRDMKMGRWKDVGQWMVVPFLFAGMLGTSLYAYKETTMSTILILRNCLPIMTLMIEKPLMDEPKIVTLRLTAAMMLAIFGTVLYGYTHMSVTKIGAILILSNCIITVIERLTVRYLLSKPDFSLSIPFCMLLNNTVGILPMLAWALVAGEIGTWGNVAMDATGGTWFWVAISGFVGTCLGMLGLKCQKIVSATTFLMLQNFNKIAVIAIDMCFMATSIGGLSLVGCAVSLGGATWYGYEQLRAKGLEQQLEKEKEPRPTVPGADAEAPKQEPAGAGGA